MNAPYIPLNDDLLVVFNDNTPITDAGFELSTFDPNIITYKENPYLRDKDLTSKCLSLIVFDENKEHYIVIYRKENIRDKHNDKQVHYLYWEITTRKDSQTKEERLLNDIFNRNKVDIIFEIFGSLTETINYVIGELEGQGLYYDKIKQDWFRA